MVFRWLFPLIPDLVWALPFTPEGMLLAKDDISALVKDLRERMGLTQEQLAHEVGVTFCTINQWENGRRRPHRFLRKRLLEMKASLDKVSTSRLAEDQARASRKRRQPV
jgi:putative transcriptional regulator